MSLLFRNKTQRFMWLEMLLLYVFSEQTFYATHHYKDIWSLQLRESFNGWENVTPVAVFNCLINSFGVVSIIPVFYLANKLKGQNSYQIRLWMMTYLIFAISTYWNVYQKQYEGLRLAKEQAYCGVYTLLCTIILYTFVRGIWK